MTENMADAPVVVPANSYLFQDLCLLLERLYKNNKKDKKVGILIDFINDFRMKVAKISAKKNSSFYPILRLLLPARERERNAYNLKEAKLAVLLVNVLSLGKKSPQAQKLYNYSSANSTAQGSDFAGIAYFVLKNLMNCSSGNVTVGDINDFLDKIATADVGNKGPILDNAFVQIMKTTTAEQMKWILRIILKDLKIGMSLNTILGAFHPDAPSLFENCGDIAKVCEELEDGNTRPLEMGIQLFYAISPMLSERLDVIKINTELSPNKTYHIEMKFDGERFQMHMQNGNFEYFSRKGFSYGDKYGKTYDSGLLTPHLKNCFGPSVHSFILDGEMMGWNEEEQRFGSKGMAFDVKKLTSGSKFRPCFCVFDVLYYNGQTLVGLPDKGGVTLSERLKILDSMFTDIPTVILHSKRQTVKGSSDILDALNKAIMDEEEGIVVKDMLSYYIANRRNAGWYKIKPEYTESTMNDLDLVVIGADEAEDKKQGRANSFYVACVDRESGDGPARWLCVGHVSSGLSLAQRQEVCELLQRHWQPTARHPQPPALLFNKQKPTYWIMPEHSTVFQIRATELIRSAEFGTDYTLRFPRVVKIRDDKPVNDVMTLTEFQHLIVSKQSVVKLSTKQVDSEQMINPGVNPIRKRKQEMKVSEEFRTESIGEVEVISKALLGREICILSDDKDCKKQELIRIVKSHGGKHVENVGPCTWCCVAGEITPRVRRIVNAQTADIVSTAWLRLLPIAETPCNFSPLDMLAIRKETKLSLSEFYDAYGDSYTKELDEDTLKRCFDKIDGVSSIYLTQQEMLNIDKEIFHQSSPFSILRTYNIHFIEPNKLKVIKAKMFGATICDMNSPDLTHVVCPKNVTDEIINDIKRKVGSLVLVVTEEWLDDRFITAEMLME